jgi:hypothetical protein
MKKNGWIAVMALLLGSVQIQAATPVWIFATVGSAPPSVVVPAGKIGSVQYTLTNNSQRTHSLVMTPIPGIIQLTTGTGVCPSPIVLAGGTSCTLSLQISGTYLQGTVTGGPVLCHEGNPLECYQPVPAANQLSITTVASSALVPPTIVPTVSGSNVVSLPTNATVQVEYTITNPTNQGNLTLSLTPIPGVTQNTSASYYCANPIFLAPGASCTLALQINGSTFNSPLTTGPQVCDENSLPVVCYTTSDPLTITSTGSPLNTATTLTLPTATGVINVPASIGPGTLTVENTGSVASLGIHATIPGSLNWTGVTQDDSNCLFLPENRSCSLRFTGTTPYLAGSGITVSDTNGSTISPSSVALAFQMLKTGVGGADPQFGLVFVLDPYGYSSSAMIVSTVDNTSSTHVGDLWGRGGGTGLNVGQGAILNQDLPDVSPVLVDNTSPIDLGTPNGYSEGIVRNCYNEPGQLWLVPSICELGTNSTTGASTAGCPHNTSNILTNLFSLGFLQDLAEYPALWSSSITTTAVGTPAGANYELVNQAWAQQFNLGSSTGTQTLANATPSGNVLNGVRCVAIVGYSP